jgi:hypothetical protein
MLQASVIVAPQSDSERDDIFDFTMMHPAITHRRARRRERIQERPAAFLIVGFEKTSAS